MSNDVHTIVAPDLGGGRPQPLHEDLIPLPDRADDLHATLVAMDRLALLYPETFRMLLIAAREGLRPTGIDARLDGHSPAPLAVRLES